MEYADLLLQLVWIPIVGYLWWVFKRMQEKLEISMSKADIKELVQDKLHPVALEVELVKTRLVRIEDKLDRLLEITLRKE